MTSQKVLEYAAEKLAEENEKLREENATYVDVLGDLYASWSPVDSVEKSLYCKVAAVLGKPVPPELDDDIPF